MRPTDQALSAKFVMPGLVPGIHVLVPITRVKDVDGRDKPGHDDMEGSASFLIFRNYP
jgi:hypothetical protein